MVLVSISGAYDAGEVGRFSWKSTCTTLSRCFNAFELGLTSCADESLYDHRNDLACSSDGRWHTFRKAYRPLALVRSGRLSIFYASKAPNASHQVNISLHNLTIASWAGRFIGFSIHRTWIQRDVPGLRQWVIVQKHKEPNDETINIRFFPGAAPPGPPLSSFCITIDNKSRCHFC